jgi:methylthioribose-1-phosphate isomerase
MFEPLDRPSGFLVVGVNQEEVGARVECETVDEAAEAVKDLIRRGYPWIHVDHLAALGVDPS